MICQASMRALDARDGVVSERLLPARELVDVSAHIEEFTDLLERRGVRFSRVVIELVPSVDYTPQATEISGYRGLFPEFFGHAPGMI